MFRSFSYHLMEQLAAVKINEAVGKASMKIRYMYVVQNITSIRILLSKSRSPLLGAYNSHIREFKQITTAGATTAAVTEKVWGEYVSVV